jgi:uncharacterized spore protein YtfJ
MSANQQGFGVIAVKNTEQAMKVLSRLFEVAKPAAVYSEPVVAGDRTVITASEVSVGIGLGLGGGGDKAGDGGSGGGGGGGSMARPVAVISIGPGGVDVEPVVDVTKLGIAFITALGALWLAGRRIKQAIK